MLNLSHKVIAFCRVLQQVFEMHIERRKDHLDEVSSSIVLANEMVPCSAYFLIWSCFLEVNVAIVIRKPCYRKKAHWESLQIKTYFITLGS